jgi:hypothetical protein
MMSPQSALEWSMRVCDRRLWISQAAYRQRVRSDGLSGDSNRDSDGGKDIRRATLVGAMNSSLNS